MKKKLCLVLLVCAFALSIGKASASSDGTANVVTSVYTVNLSYNDSTTFQTLANSIFHVATTFTQVATFTIQCYRANVAPAYIAVGPSWPYIPNPTVSVEQQQPSYIYIIQQSPVSPLLLVLVICVPSLVILVSAEDRRKKRRRRLKNMWET